MKVFRPHAEDNSRPQAIGNHGDYVKCVASPSDQASWIAAAGLDREIALWDLDGGGDRLRIKVTDEGSEKGSVYALAAKDTLIASGGPESIVKLWDSRSGKRVMQLIGHTDNIRAILISESRDKLVTAVSLFIAFQDISLTGATKRTMKRLVARSIDTLSSISSIPVGRPCVLALEIHETH